MKPEWLKWAEGEIGVKEIIGEEDNLRIVEYLRSVPARFLPGIHDEVLWCSAFVNAAVKNVGLPGIDSITPQDRIKFQDKYGVAFNPLLAQAWLYWGIKCGAVLGAIAVLQRGSEAWQGHAGFYLDSRPGEVFLLGGNQSNMVSRKWYAENRIIDYRWPTPMAHIHAVDRRAKVLRVKDSIVVPKQPVPGYEVDASVTWVRRLDWKKAIASTMTIFGWLMQIFPTTMVIGRGMVAAGAALTRAPKKKDEGNRFAALLKLIAELINQWFKKKRNS